MFWARVDDSISAHELTEYPLQHQVIEREHFVRNPLLCQFSRKFGGKEENLHRTPASMRIICQRPGGCLGNQRAQPKHKKHRMHNERHPPGNNPMNIFFGTHVRYSMTKSVMVTLPLVSGVGSTALCQDKCSPISRARKSKSFETRQGTACWGHGVCYHILDRLLGKGHHTSTCHS